MKVLEKIVNGGGAKTLKHSNSNQLDQIYWPIILHTQVRSVCKIIGLFLCFSWINTNKKMHNKYIINHAIKSACKQNANVLV